jgi:hypothetical protein
MPDETNRSGMAWLEAAGRQPMYDPACNLYAMFRMVRPGPGPWWRSGRWSLPAAFSRVEYAIDGGTWFVTAAESACWTAERFDALPENVRAQLWEEAPLARAHAEAADLAAAL